MIVHLLFEKILYRTLYDLLAAFLNGGFQPFSNGMLSFRYLLYTSANFNQ